MSANPASAPAEHIRNGLAALNAVKVAARAEADRLAVERTTAVAPENGGGQPAPKSA